MTNTEAPARFDVKDAEGAGLHPRSLEAAAEVVIQECMRGSFPGAAFAVARGGKVALQGAVGQMSPTRDEPVTVGTLFDLASVTKPMTAAVAALLLVEDGSLSLLQEAREFFPERELPHLAGVTLRHLITHTSGIPAWIDLYSDTTTAEQALEKLLALPLGRRPGEHYEYSCLGYILLGTVCRIVAGRTLQELLRERVWKPLGMNHTGYLPESSHPAGIASTAHCPARDYELVGEVHDGNAWRLGGISGNAGLFSDLGDILTFCGSILGWDATPRVLCRLALQKYTQSQIDPAIGGQSFGWFCRGNDMLPAGDLLPADTFGHTGYTGTSVVMSPGESLAIVLLTNRVVTDRDGSEIRRTRRRFHNMIARAII